MPGPPPKRSEQRRRANKPEVPVERRPGAAKVRVPAAPGSWHPVAKRWFNSLKTSGQVVFYEPSDWATAYVIAESMSRELHPQVVSVTDEGQVIKAELPPKGASLSAWLKAMTSLMVTEGDRRRLRLELVRQQEAEAPDDVSELAEYRRRLQSV